MKKTIIALMLLVSTTVWATEAEPTMRYNSPNAVAGATAIAATNTYQTTTVNTTNKNESVITSPSSATLTINEASAPSRVRIENTPDVYAPNVAPTAPCMGGTSVGGTGPGFGISFGTSWESKTCMILEAARSFEQAGYHEDALHIRCQNEYAAIAPSCKNLNKN